MAVSRRKLARLYIGLVPLTITLQLMGAATRATGSGLSCPDWPLCMDQVVPELSHGIFYEFGHRVLAGLVAIGLFVALLKGRKSEECREALGKTPIVAAVLLTAQILMGGVTVLVRNAGWTVMLHLLLANLFCAVLLVATLKLTGQERVAEKRSAALRLGYLGAATILAQLVIGGLLAGYHGGLACLAWPECMPGMWFPTWQGPVGLHVIHRLVAYLAVGVALFAGIRWRSIPESRTLGNLVIWTALVQLGLGIANVLLMLPPWVTTLHTGGASALVLIYTAAIYTLAPPAKD